MITASGRNPATPLPVAHVAEDREAPDSRTGQLSPDTGLFRLSQYPHILLNIMFLCRLFEAGWVSLERPDFPGQSCLGGDSRWTRTRPLPPSQ